MGKKQLKCDNCGASFERYASNVKDSTKHNFCCLECKRDFFKGIKVRRACKQCGKEFEVYKKAIEKSNASGNFCCRKCYNKYQTTLTGDKNNHYTSLNCKCDYCGKDIRVRPSKKREYRFSFCGNDCKIKFMSKYMAGEKNPFWHGGASRYRGNFDSVKKDHFSGQRFCAVCGTPHHIHIHHIIPYRLTQDNSLGNLIPLCRRHHKIIESVSVKFIDLFENSNYDVAKKYLSILLRGRQLETYSRIREAHGQDNGTKN